MAAYESWAGGQISTPVGGVRTRGSSGGYIPVAEIPNVPKTVSMPMYHPQAPPDIRYEYARKPPDVKSRAADLMQKPLPSSFEEAGAMRAESAGTGQMAYGKAAEAAGKATSEIGQDFSKAMFGASAIMTKIAQQAQESADETAKIQASQAIETYNAELKRITDTENPDKWDSLKAEADKNLLGVTSQLGRSKGTHDVIQATAQGATRSGGQKLAYATGLKEIQQGQKLATDLVEEGRSQKDYAKAERGVASLEAQHVINADQAKEMRSKNQFLQGVDAVDEAKKGGSATSMMLRDQAEVVMKGGTSKDFPVLNTNKNLAPNIKYEAEQALKQHKAADLKDIEDRIENGELNTDEKIDAAAKGKFFTKDTIAGLKRKDLVVPFSAKAVADVRHLINNYDYHTDTDGLQYETIKAQIRATIPKDNRAIYESTLTEKMKKAIDNKADTPTQNAGKLIKNQAKELSETARLADTSEERADLISAREVAARLKAGHKVGNPDAAITKEDLEYEKKPGEGGTYRLSTKQAAALEKDGQRLFDLQEATDAYIRDHPEATYDELKEHVFQKTPAAQNIEKNAGESTKVVPRAVENDVLARERKIAEAKNLPAGMGAVPPRQVNKATPEYTRIVNSSDERYTVNATAYTPGRGNVGMEGKKELGGPAKRPGEPYTMEDYQAGLRPYVTMAMDSNSPLQGQFVTYSQHPNVVFKVEDVGGAFEGKGNNRVDIASRNDAWRSDYKTDGTLTVISAAQAAEINGTNKLSANAPAIPAGADAVASIEKTSNAGATNQMTHGTLNIGGKPYEYNSGGYGRGNLPPGKYVVTEHMHSRDTPGMTVGDVGFSFALSDSFDKRVGGTRTLLRIHPDGGTSGTAGCIGIVGGKDVQKQFRDDLTAQIRANGGKLVLQVG